MATPAEPGAEAAGPSAAGPSAAATAGAAAKGAEEKQEEVQAGGLWSSILSSASARSHLPERTVLFVGGAHAGKTALVQCFGQTEEEREREREREEAAERGRGKGERRRGGAGAAAAGAKQAATGEVVSYYYFDVDPEQVDDEEEEIEEEDEEREGGGGGETSGSDDDDDGDASSGDEGEDGGGAESKAGGGKGVGAAAGAATATAAEGTVSVWCLSDMAFARVLSVPLQRRKDGPVAVMIAVDLTAPDEAVDTVLLWASLLKRLMLRVGVLPAAEGEATKPPCGVGNSKLGCPLLVVGCKCDAIENATGKARVAHQMLQSKLRHCCVELGASLVYTSVRQDWNVRRLHRLLLSCLYPDVFPACTDSPAATAATAVDSMGMATGSGESKSGSDGGDGDGDGGADGSGILGAAREPHRPMRLHIIESALSPFVPMGLDSGEIAGFATMSDLPHVPDAASEEELDNPFASARFAECKAANPPAHGASPGTGGGGAAAAAQAVDTLVPEEEWLESLQKYVEPAATRTRSSISHAGSLSSAVGAAKAAATTAAGAKPAAATGSAPAAAAGRKTGAAGAGGARRATVAHVDGGAVGGAKAKEGAPGAAAGGGDSKKVVRDFFTSLLAKPAASSAKK